MQNLNLITIRTKYAVFKDHLRFSVNNLYDSLVLTLYDSQNLDDKYIHLFHIYYGSRTVLVIS